MILTPAGASGGLPTLAPNPFFEAEAIFIDAGASFFGSESDIGAFFVLSGEDKGAIIPFGELAVGLATDSGGGIEIGRVDIEGNPDDFKSDSLFGERTKIRVAGGAGIVSGGGAITFGSFNGKKVIGSAVEIGVGPSSVGPSGGANYGVVGKL
ncbi:hypothetical protein [Reichenbachiella versicolor]|uniref:hypothetical protein n=1 Tax=Reichenbachiella versicolor TaxID=1821036 RepID=UPI000D6DD9F3|nr:hypothetical protein [Reichenbachiella versicolor]